eukprot:3728880-Prymnesium_polylepis.1
MERLLARRDQTIAPTAAVAPPGDRQSPTSTVILGWQPYGRTAGPRRTQRRYRESGLNFQTGSPRLPVIEIGSQVQI